MLASAVCRGATAAPKDRPCAGAATQVVACRGPQWVGCGCWPSTLWLCIPSRSRALCPAGSSRFRTTTAPRRVQAASLLAGIGVVPSRDDSHDAAVLVSVATASLADAGAAPASRLGAENLSVRATIAVASPTGTLECTPLGIINLERLDQLTLLIPRTGAPRPGLMRARSFARRGRTICHQAANGVRTRYVMAVRAGRAAYRRRLARRVLRTERCGSAIRSYSKRQSGSQRCSRRW
jgi:hypothetical protein